MPLAIQHEQYQDNLRRPATMLYPHESPSTLSVLRKEKHGAVQAREDGAPYEEAEGFAWRRSEWRVRYGLVDPSQIEEALLLLAAIIPLGMALGS